jgi:hypothetical protein
MFQTHAAMILRRRVAALALFQGTHLQGVIVRNIPSDEQRAQSTITSFIRQVCSKYHFEDITFEQGVKPTERIERSYEFARIAFADQSSLPSKVSFRDLLVSFASQPLRDRHQLREIAKRIWPALNNRRCSIAALDAALVGLHIQTKRLLKIHDKAQ